MLSDFTQHRPLDPQHPTLVLAVLSRRVAPTANAVRSEPESAAHAAVVRPRAGARRIGHRQQVGLLAEPRVRHRANEALNSRFAARMVEIARDIVGLAREENPARVACGKILP